MVPVPTPIHNFRTSPIQLGGGSPWYSSLFFFLGDIDLNNIVFALYNYSAKIGVLVAAMVITDTTIALLAGFSIYHQANFGPTCSTEGGKFSLFVPCVFDPASSSYLPINRT